MTTAMPTASASTPWVSESWPSVGPTARLSEYVSVTGSEPESRTVLSEFASSAEKLPEMETWPPVISD